jgi:arsenite transporter
VAAFAWLARHGRLVLVAGLVLGIAWPALARAMQPLIVPMIAFLLFLAAVRIGPAAARPAAARCPLRSA